MNQYKTTNELYKTSFNTNWFDFRTNVNMKVNKYLSSFLRLSGNIRRDRTPNASVSGLYSHLFYRAPNVYGPITPTIYDEDGVTVLDGTGWYSQNHVKVLVVLAYKRQSNEIFQLVKEVDPNAFESQSSVIGVYGEGFDRLKAK